MPQHTQSPRILKRNASRRLHREKLLINLCGICSVDLPAPATPPAHSTTMIFFRNQNWVGILIFLCFEYLTMTSPVGDFLLEHSRRIDQNLIFFFSVTVLMCVYVCASINRRVNVLLLFGPLNYLGHRFFCLFCFLIGTSQFWHCQSRNFDQSYNVVYDFRLTPQRAMLNKNKALWGTHPANGCYFHKHRCPCSEYLLRFDKWCFVLSSEP